MTDSDRILSPIRAPDDVATAVRAAEDELGAGAGLDALVRLALRKAAK